MEQVHHGSESFWPIHLRSFLLVYLVGTVLALLLHIFRVPYICVQDT